MTSITLIGIDPGLVDTGIVSISLEEGLKRLRIRHAVVSRPHAAAVAAAVVKLADPVLPNRIFIEKYRQRGTVFQTNDKMLAFEGELKREIPTAKLLDNTGIKNVVLPDLMKMFGVWTFAQKTNHQDLRSAARIALYGGLKDKEHNRVITKFVHDELAGDPWQRV